MKKTNALKSGLVQIGNTRIFVSIFTFVSVLLVVISDASVYTAALLLGAALHEAGHIIALAFCGEKPQKICIYPFGIDMKCTLAGISYKKELIVLLSGSFANIVISMFSMIICAFFYSRIALFITLCNAFLGLSNLIPINGLDGGRALYTFLCMRNDSEQNVYAFCKKVTNISYMIMSLVFTFIIFITRANFSVIIMLSLFAMGTVIASNVLK